MGRGDEGPRKLPRFLAGDPEGEYWKRPQKIESNKDTDASPKEKRISGAPGFLRA